MYSVVAHYRPPFTHGAGNSGWYGCVVYPLAFLKMVVWVMGMVPNIIKRRVENSRFLRENRQISSTINVKRSRQTVINL